MKLAGIEFLSSVYFVQTHSTVKRILVACCCYSNISSQDCDPPNVPLIKNYGVKVNNGILFRSIHTIHCWNNTHYTQQHRQHVAHSQTTLTSPPQLKRGLLRHMCPTLVWDVPSWSSYTINCSQLVFSHYTYLGSTQTHMPHRLLLQKSVDHEGAGYRLSLILKV